MCIRDSVEGDALTFSLVTGAANGTVVVNSDGTYTYTPNADYFGPDSFTYKVNDGSLDSNVATVSITVSSVNDAPVASGTSVTTAEDSAASGTLAAQATDVEGDALTFSLVTGAANGTVVVNSDGTYTYTPNADYFGPDSFTYKVNDGSLDSNVATVSITVSSVNDAPVASGTSVTTAEDSAASGTLAAQATDVEGDALTFSLVTGAANGTVVVNSDGTYTYTPNADYFGPDSFTYKVNDGSLDSNVATVSITVSSVNDAPVASGTSVTTAEDSAASGTLAAQATDVEGDALTFSLVTGAANGTVVVNSDGTYTYTPNADYFGPDSFTYKVNDGSLDSNVATVSITVSSVNDAPVASGTSVTTAEDSA